MKERGGEQDASHGATRMPALHYRLAFVPFHSSA